MYTYLTFFSNGNKNKNKAAKRVSHLQNGGQKLIKKLPLTSGNKNNTSKVLEDSKYPDRITEEQEGQNDEVAVVSENSFDGDRDVEDNDRKKTIVSTKASNSEVTISI